MESISLKYLGKKMSFKSNSFNQLSFNDSAYELTEREQRFLEKSWAKSFPEIVFPAINEDPFSVLYSQNIMYPIAWTLWVFKTLTIGH